MKKPRKTTLGQVLGFIGLLTTGLSAYLLGVNVNNGNHELALLWGAILLMNVINLTFNAKVTY